MTDEPQKTAAEKNGQMEEGEKKTPEQPSKAAAPGVNEQVSTTCPVPDKDGGTDLGQTAKQPAHGNVIDISSAAIDKILADKKAAPSKVGQAAETEEKTTGKDADEDTRQEWEKSSAELEAEKQAEKRRNHPPKAEKSKAQAKADKAPKQTSTPKVEKSTEPKTATKEAAAPPEPSLEEKKQKLEAELREKYGIAKTDKPVEPWVAPEVEQVVRLPHEKLHAFKDHPFNVEKNPKFLAFVASIRAQGVTQPVIVRPDGKDGYEIISGHRRDAGSIEAGVPFTPCIIRALNDEQAIQQMVEDNVNNREISTMELARALKMQLEAIKHQGAREALSGQDFTADVDKRSNEVIAERNGMSVKQVQRHIGLTRLVPPLQDLVDGKVAGGDGKPLKIGFTTAVELSGIVAKNQNYIASAIEGQQASPSLSQAQRMRELDKQGKLNGDIIDGIMCEEKKEVDKVIISGAELGKYFGEEKTPQEMKAQIIKLLDDWKGKEKEQAAPEKKASKEK